MEVGGSGDAVVGKIDMATPTSNLRAEVWEGNWRDEDYMYESDE